MLGGDQSYVRCKHCNSDEVAPSRCHGLEAWLKYVGIRPYRCLVCSRRFFGATGRRIKSVEQEDWWK
jgi:DNA-directed RNA polymerase subunit RPC12/RpoP